MTGFRLDDGSGGCPPTASAPGDYEIPFRFDGAGSLWITSCFKGFRYFGAARYGLLEPVLIGSGSAPTMGALTEIIDGSALYVTAGTYTNLNISNQTECDIGIVLGHDTTADMETYGPNLVSWVVGARWGGAHHSLSSYSNPQIQGSTVNLRMVGSASANPHDGTLESTGAAGLLLPSGASGTVGLMNYISYGGTPTGSEVIHSAASAVRVYGYVL